MRKMKNISFMFIAIFTIIMIGKNVNAVSIVKYQTEADIENAIVNVNESTVLKDSEKKSKIEEIVKLSSKEELKSLIEKKINKVQEAFKNDNITLGTNQKITKKIDKLVTITIEGKDEAEDENGNPIPEPQGQLWKAYGSRMYTYTCSSGIIPYLWGMTVKLINHYTVSAKGLTTRHLEHAHVTGYGMELSNIKTIWEDKSANKVGTDIDSKAQWQLKVWVDIPSVGPIGTSFTFFQKAYVKIVKWDKTKKKMYLNQHGKVWLP